jgi:hypothetical protein
MVKETNEAEIDLIYIDSEGDSHWLNDELALEYHEIHAICEGLKMAHNYIRKQILLDEDYGWGDTTKAPIKKVAISDIKTARAKLDYLRKFMASMYQRGHIDGLKYEPEIFNDERIWENGHPV